MPLNVPNLVTWLRIIMIPLIIGVFYLPDAWLSYTGKNVAACAIFVLAALSDWLDGYLARALNQTSAFGAFLDPVADKLVVAAALIMLVQLERVEPVIALIIIGREIAISALREWMAKLGQSASVAVAYIGKVKTVDADGRHSAAAVPRRPVRRAEHAMARHHPDQRGRGADGDFHAALPAPRAAARPGLSYNLRPP